jgi:hypothetical protein
MTVDNLAPPVAGPAKAAVAMRAADAASDVRMVWAGAMLLSLLERRSNP